MKVTTANLGYDGGIAILPLEDRGMCLHACPGELISNEMLGLGICFEPPGGVQNLTPGSLLRGHFGQCLGSLQSSGIKSGLR